MIKKIFKKLRKNGEQYIENHEHFDRALIEWKAPTHHVHERGLIWLIGFSLFIIAMVIYGITDGNWTMSVAFILVALVYYLEHQKPVRLHTIKVSRAGIKIGSRIYPYSNIDGFWIIYHPPFVRTLHFSFHQKHKRTITVQLADCDHDMLKNVLRNHIPEFEGKEESLADIFARAFKL